MGYGAAPWRRRRQRRNRWLIAHAALAGAVVVKQRVAALDNDGLWHCRWVNYYPDGQVSHHYRSRGEASAVYLAWWLRKQGML